MYDHAWEQYRKRFLKENRECYACGKLAEVVDHLVPHQGDKTLFEKLDNHIPLCIVCHNTVTTKFDRKATRGKLSGEKVAWLNQRRGQSDNWVPKSIRVLPSYR